jgi:hypothetical protein
LQQGEFHVGLRVIDDRLAGQPIVVAEEVFRPGARGEGLTAAFDLDNALVANPITSARSWDQHRELVGIIE